MFRSPVSQRYPIHVIFLGTLLISILINLFVFSPFISLAHSLTPHSADTPQVTVNQPIIFVHGLNQNAYDMGKSTFVPLYTELEALYGKIETFQYVDDRAYGSSCPPYPS